MVLVDAEACPKVEQTCRRWVDPPTSRYHLTRCAEFAPPRCLAPREHRRYCIDEYEYVRPPETVPMVNVSFTDAEASCEQRGASLCTEPEWELACEGEAMQPYPYGLVRDSSACNFDRTDLGKPNAGLVDHRAPPGSFPACVSPFGVRDMVGNVDEWTMRERAAPPHRAALHGGWWLPGRNNCFAATLGHAEEYRGPQVGFRCCSAAR
jgi:sulfatase modifying factor 1